MVLEVLKSFLLIFFSEMGDKTQIMAMTFATKYKMRYILLGVFLGAGLNHSLAIILGTIIMKKISFKYIFIFAGIIFIIFGITSLTVNEEEIEDKKSKFGGVITVALAFFVGELGDKTQLAALTLGSSSKFPGLILLGTVSGMVFTSFIGISVGKKLGDKVPEFKLKVGASIVFIIFGFEKLISSHMFYNKELIFAIIVFVTFIIYMFKYKRYKLDYEKFEETIYSKKAKMLKKYFLSIKGKLDLICLGEENCMECDGERCAVGYMKKLLNDIIFDSAIDFDKKEIEKLIIKNFDKDKIKNLLEYIDSLENEFTTKESIKIIEEIRNILKNIYK